MLLLSLLKHTTLFILVSFFGIGEAPNAYPILLHNASNQTAMPKQFRMAAQVLDDPLGSKISERGLASLCASASAQFSEQELYTLLRVIPTRKLVIFDLREESHGFLNGAAVSWYLDNNWANKGKTFSEILEDEDNKLKDLLQHGIAVVHEKKEGNKAHSVKVLSVMSEEELLDLVGIKYVRIPVRDHVRPSDELVDQFVKYVNALPESSWMHFHCKAGKARSTTFFAMYDMLRNAKYVSFDDIIARQKKIGGKDLKNIPDKNHWKHSYSKERLRFLEKFYQYCLEADSEEQSWIEWVKGS